MPVWALQPKLTTANIVHDHEGTIMSLRLFILRSDIGNSHYGLFNWSRVNNRLYTCLVVSTLIHEVTCTCWMEIVLKSATTCTVVTATCIYVYIILAMCT